MNYVLSHSVTSVMESIDENCSRHATWEGQLVINNQDLVIIKLINK